MFPSLVATGQNFLGVQDLSGKQRASKVYTGAEAWAHTGHRSGGQVHLGHAAVLGCATPACMWYNAKSSGESFTAYEFSILSLLVNILLWIF